MKKVVFVFGGIAGIIVSIFGFIIMALCKNELFNFDYGDFFGYSVMVIALSLIFFGVKSYRDNYQKGVIKFGKALLVGLSIALFASAVWAAVSVAYFEIDPETNEAFMNKYCEYQIDKLKASGASQEEVDAKVKQITEMHEMQKNPLLNFVMTVAIILPVGIIIALISAAILRKRGVLPAQ